MMIFDLITAEKHSLETVHIKFKTAYQIKMTKTTERTEAVIKKRKESDQNQMWMKNSNVWAETLQSQLLASQAQDSIL